MKLTSEQRKEKARQADRDRYESRRDYMKNYLKEYYLKNKEKVLIRVDKWGDENKDKVVLAKIKWAKNNPNYKRDYLKNNVQGRLANNLRTRIRSSLKRNKARRGGTSEVLLGISIADVRKHIEKQFSEGMTWENYGEWHIDHIKPLFLFDLTKPEEQMLAFNYKNLQPMWAVDNLRKNKKYAS